MLNYPSVVKVSNSSSEINLTIGEHSKVYGAVIGESKDAKNSKAIFSKGTVIAGDVFFSGELQLKQTEIMGRLFTDSFYHKTKESEYGNVVIDLSIKTLPEFFSRIHIFEKEKELKWDLIKRIK